MKKFKKLTALFLIVSMLSSFSIFFVGDSKVEAATIPTLTDLWNGNATFELYYERPYDMNLWHEAAGTDIEVVGNTWYWFQRYGVTGQDKMGMECRSSTDNGLTWSDPVKVLEPTSTIKFITDGDFIYDSENNKWRCLIQTYPNDGPWNMCYYERAGASPMGPFTTPAGFTNPAVDSREIWGRITTAPGKHSVDIPGGTNRVYDEGTPQIVTKVGNTYYVTFHGASGDAAPIHGYRGIATTTDFQNWTPAAPDCIQDQYDSSSWDVAWQGKCIGVGAASIIKEGDYWYSMIESADINLGGAPGQNWCFGLMRSTSLTSTNWENYPLNPVFKPHKELLEWQYAQLFKGADGTTYCAINKANPATERAFQIYKLVSTMQPRILDKCRSTAGWNGYDSLYVGNILDKCDSTSGWAGSNSIALDTSDKKEGTASLTSTGNGIEWFKKSFSTPLNTGVSESDGYLMVWVYVSDGSKLTGDGQIEIGSSGMYDVNEYSWPMPAKLSNGWNQLILKISKATKIGSPNLSSINWVRIYKGLTTSVVKKVDHIYFLKADTQLSSVGSGTEWFKISYPSHMPSGVTEADGYLSLSVYISDVSKFNGEGQIEIGSSGIYDVNEYSWLLSGVTLVNGWNTLNLKISNANKIGAPDLNRINWFRIYRPLSGSVTRQIKDIHFHN